VPNGTLCTRNHATELQVIKPITCFTRYHHVAVAILGIETDASPQPVTRHLLALERSTDTPVGAWVFPESMMCLTPQPVG
jgi:hypothetical protein